MGNMFTNTQLFSHLRSNNPQRNRSLSAQTSRGYHIDLGEHEKSVVAKPGTCSTYKKFEAEIYVFTKDEGGRHTAFITNYMPQFYLRTTDVTGRVELAEDVKMVLPGDNVIATFELISPVPLQPRLFISPTVPMYINEICRFFKFV